MNHKTDEELVGLLINFAPYGQFSAYYTDLILNEVAECGTAVCAVRV